MYLTIPKDMFDNPTQPPIFLCNTDKTIIGELPAYDANLDAKWNSYSELSFSIDHKYIDILTGEQCIHPLFDKTEGLRKVYVYGVGYFVIQDPDTTYSDQEVKTLKCFSSEYENGQKYLESFYINTGETNSAEVIYLENKYGTSYDVKDLYVANGGADYDPYQKYYVKTYESNGELFTYEQVTISNEDEFAMYDGSTVAKTLYIKKYDNVRFYWPSHPELSLLHIIFKKIPCWSIGHVDAELCGIERQFEEERIAVYDFMMNTMSETVGCIVEWDTINNKANFYYTEEDGITAENSVQTLFDSDVYISRDNLATEIQVSYSSDDIKTKLRVSGGSDDIDIRDVNLGQNYIINLDYYNTIDWFGEDLYNAWNSYTQLLADKTVEYEAAITKWTAAYNAWDELMNAVPATNDVLLVGDVFTKLYCIYTALDDSDGAIQAAEDALIKKLNLYYTKETSGIEKNDNVLLTLKDSNENSATIRVKYEDDTYQVKLSKHNASTGFNEEPQYFSLKDWVLGNLTADHSRMSVVNYKVTSIGTLGAYLCLARDESKPENLQDYGIKLLQEKRDIYMKIFNTQTEGLFSSEKNQCVAQSDAPTGDIPVGTFWLETDVTPLVLWQYSKTGWVKVDTEEDLKNCQDYVRFIDNYDKLQAVQEVLADKTTQATYWLNGFVVDGFYVTDENVTELALKTAAETHFEGQTVDGVVYDDEFQIYTFTVSGKSYMVYLQNGKPYVSYVDSVGASQCYMNYLKTVTDMETYFTEAQWARLSPFIREDEYSNDNIAFMGYESEVEKLDLRKELLKEAQNELKKICQPSLSFSMDMANILALPEFAPILSRFKLGNYVKVELRPGYVQRARLLEVHWSLSDLSDFSADFGNLITTKSEIDKHTDLLKQAVTAGKTVASSSNNWQKGADKATALDKAINEGLKDAALSVGSAYGQSITWDQYGIRCKKLVDGTTNQYEDKQLAIINNKLVFTDDNWQTSKAALGEFTVNINGEDVTLYGLLAQAVVSGYINGSIIEGGEIDIGNGNFTVNRNGEVTMRVADITEYVKEEDIIARINEILDTQTIYSTEISSTNSTVFNSIEQTTTLICSVYAWGTDITNTIDDTCFQWYKSINGQDTLFASGTKTITVTYEDMKDNAIFYCIVTLNEEEKGE